MKFQTFVELSRESWGAKSGGLEGDVMLAAAAVAVGCLQRMAIASEAIAEEYTKLARDNEKLRSLLKEKQEEIDLLKRSRGR